MTTSLIQVLGIKLHRNLFGKLRPYIVLKWENVDKLDLVPIELANMLVSQSTYKNKARNADRTLKTECVTIKGGDSKLIKRKVGDVKYRCYSTYNNITIAITNFELARTLFFHNQHLIRTVFSPNGLKELASYNDDPKDPKIIFPKSTNYPVSNIRSRKSILHLAWLMTDSKVAKSVFSIYQFYNRIDSSDVFEFEFTPVSLSEWDLEVVGTYSDDGKIFWVSEIITVNNNSFSTPIGLKVKHPKLKKIVPVTNKKPPGIRLPPSDPDPELDMGDLPKLGKRLYQKNDQKFSFDFPNAIGVGREFEGDKELPDKPKNFQSEEGKTEKASVGNATPSGNNQEFDYTLNRNEDDKPNKLIDAEPTAKFNLFKRAIDIIGAKKSYAEHGVRCGYFPPSKTGKQMVLNTVDKKYLRYHMANISYLGVGAVVIEVDVDSLIHPKNVSTLVVSFLDEPEQTLQTILQDYSDLACGWNHEWIKKNTAVCWFCRHPKKHKKENGGDRSITADEYVEAWAEILSSKLKDIHSAVGNEIK